MEESIMPSGVSRAVSARPTPVDHLEKIVDLLQAAILAGDANRAKEIAGRLATEKICLLIQLNKEHHEKRIAENSISVKVHVEDRETSGCSINMRVKPSDTIGDLKKRMCLEYEFPVEVQRWIIGRKIPKDRETLHRCGVRTSGHTLYLYLTTGRSVGLDQQQGDQMNRGATGSEITGDYMTMAQFSRESSHGANPQTSRQASTISSNSGTTFSAISENEQTSVAMPNPLRTSESSSSMGQGRSQGHQRGQSQVSPDLQDNTVFATGPPVSSSGLQGGFPVLQPQAEAPNVGWECPMCTFLNRPTRPGCEVCGGSRPDDYQPPIDYVMSKEELCWLAEGEEQTRMMEEEQGQRGGEAVNNEDLTEEQLDLILRFNDALVNLQQSRGGQRADVPLGRLGQNVINLQANNVQPAQMNERLSPLPPGEDVPDHSTLEEDVFDQSDEDNTEA